MKVFNHLGFNSPPLEAKEYKLVYHDSPLLATGRFIFIMSVFLILLNNTSVFSQVYMQWVNRYSYSNLSPHLGYDLLINDSGFVYVTGVSATFGRNDMVILKYSNNGEKVWSRRYDTTSNTSNGGGCIILDDSNNLYIGGNLLWKYDENGNLEWNTQTPPGRGFQSLFFDMNYNILVSSEFANSSFLLRKFSYNGDPLWERTYKPVGTIFAKWSDAIIDNENNIITIGFMNKFGIGDMYDCVIVKYSENGDLIWAQRYDTGIDNYCYSVTVDKLNNIYVTGNSDVSTTDMLTIKYSSQGNVVWQKVFDGGLGDTGYDIEVDSERNVYVAGRSGGYGLTLTKYDENGNTLWFRNRPDNGIGNVPILKLDKDGNPYMAFWITTQQGGQLYAVEKYDINGNQKWLAQYGVDSSHSLQKIYDVLIDSNLNVYVTGRSNNFIATVKFVQNPTSINNVDNSVAEEYSLFQNYPNPFNPVTAINYSIPKSGFVILKVYNNLGNEIATLVNENQAEGSYKVEFSATSGGIGLPSGIYYYRLETENFKETKKMILLK
ncbi:MAG: SBBP repeat-containing protein [Ignavibacteriae bacterium]|nr:SBBP repeat-containing protein [Ignavibacteriota bacterium]